MVQHPQELPITAHNRRQELVREVVSNWRWGGVQGTTGKSDAGDEEGGREVIDTNTVPVSCLSPPEMHVLSLPQPPKR